MRLRVNPNRMELIKLRRRIVIARRGHKLLQDKLEQLMPKFLLYIKQAKELSVKNKERFALIMPFLVMAKAKMPQESFLRALDLVKSSIEFQTTEFKIMNVTAPNIQITKNEVEIKYNFQETTAELDMAVIRLNELMPDLIKFGQLLKICQMLAEEIERTRRRVNALKYLLIPSIIETIDYIEAKLSEFERENIVRLMVVKDIVRGH